MKIKERAVDYHGPFYVFELSDLFTSELQTCYNGVFSQSFVNRELADDLVVVCAADDECWADLRISVLEEYRFCKMCICELLMVNYIPVVVLDDQGEFFGSGVIEFHFENDVVIAGALVFNRNLLFSQGRFFAVVDTAAISLAGHWVANENYY